MYILQDQKVTDKITFLLNLVSFMLANFNGFILLLFFFTGSFHKIMLLIIALLYLKPRYFDIIFVLIFIYFTLACY